MPPELEVCDLNGWAVLWPHQGVQQNGEAIFGTPVQIPVRWVWRQSSMIGSEGVRVAVDARVVVDRDIGTDSLLWEGELADLTGTGSFVPTNGADGMRVAVANYGRDFRYDPRRIRRTLGLVFYKGRFPPTVVPTV